MRHSLDTMHTQEQRPSPCLVALENDPEVARNEALRLRKREARRDCRDESFFSVASSSGSGSSSKLKSSLGRDGRDGTHGTALRKSLRSLGRDGRVLGKELLLLGV